MYKHLQLITILSLFSFSNVFSQEYCIPPLSYDHGGEDKFTGITKVAINDGEIFSNETDYNDLYQYFDNFNIELSQGNTYDLTIGLFDKLNSTAIGKVWIDWNGDKVFDPASEYVTDLYGSQSYPEATYKIQIPHDAKLGETRMRVYCDMPKMGTTPDHIDPEPCGYLDHSDNPIGQHGNVEDYLITIVGPTTPFLVTDKIVEIGEVNMNEELLVEIPIQNSGVGDLIIEDAFIKWDDEGSFSIDESQLPFTVSGGETKNFLVKMLPIVEGNFNGYVQFESNATNVKDFRVEMIAVGVKVSKPAEFSSSVDHYNFGEIGIGLDDKLTIEIANTGEQVLKVNQIVIQGNETEFSIDTLINNFEIEPTEEYSFDVTFKPEDEKAYGIELKFETNVGTHTMTFSGAGKLMASIFSNAKLSLGYPNPVNKSFSVNLPDVSSISDISLVNLNSKETLINSYNFNNGELTLQLNPNLEKGIYYLIVNGNVVSKFIK
jgi:hypothetical protein